MNQVKICYRDNVFSLKLEKKEEEKKKKLENLWLLHNQSNEIKRNGRLSSRKFLENLHPDCENMLNIFQMH